jgi:isoamylase
MATMKTTPQCELHDYVADISTHIDVRAGSPLPLGIPESEGGVNFAGFSRRASRIRVQLFDHRRHITAIDLDSPGSRTGKNKKEN